ncbi:MAG: [FeFe] hydrogenase H-cluster radical SAM maturase HydG [Nitrospirae bacterium]|nr:[FeFe] hydrogenase H-cluster radical SAM maturase HydG [Nitrospirota bacterium]
MHREMIPIEEIEQTLKTTGDVSAREARSIIQKAEGLKGLTPDEAAVLLQCRDKQISGLLYQTAKRVKESIYGNRLVLFAPLYLTNTCINNCLYCGFRRANRTLERRVLSEEDIRSETETLIRDGHKRVLVVAGESPRECGIDYLERAIKTIYSTKIGHGEIRRINVNVAPLHIGEFRRLKAAGIGTYQLFQETYHLPTYQKVHPSGPKSDYHHRLTALDRAMEAGIDDVGMGVLFGLYDYRFEVLALLYHARYLEKKSGVGPHTVSVPRIEPAAHAPLSTNLPSAVSDEDFMKLIAVLRLAIPYTGIILSTRESAGLRDKLFHIGVSQISASSKTYPGGYTETSPSNNPPISPFNKGGLRGIWDKAGFERGQFTTSDLRSTSEVIRDISQDGFSPSFCTACYRVGRTGQEFMDHAKPGHIQKFCLPNSILSFKEYLLDYGGEELRKIGESLIEKQTAAIQDAHLRKATLKKLQEIEMGKRDLYF